MLYLFLGMLFLEKNLVEFIRILNAHTLGPQNSIFKDITHYTDAQI